MGWRNDAALGRLIRIAAGIRLGGLNAACFPPVYATETVGGGPGVRAMLAQVEVDWISAPNGTADSRIANEIQNALKFELNGGNGIAPSHRLKGNMVTSRSNF